MRYCLRPQITPSKKIKKRTLVTDPSGLKYWKETEVVEPRKVGIRVAEGLDNSGVTVRCVRPSTEPSKP
jgi:hypothetical protein